MTLGPTRKNPWSTLEHTGSMEQVQARISSASHWLAAHSLATLKDCLVGHPKVAQQRGGLLRSIENGYVEITMPTMSMHIAIALVVDMSIQTDGNDTITLALLRH